MWGDICTWENGRLATPPFGFTADAVDSELAEILEVSSELVSAHGQARTGAAARA